MGFFSTKLFDALLHQTDTNRFFVQFIFLYSLFSAFTKTCKTRNKFSEKNMKTLYEVSKYVFQSYLKTKWILKFSE